MAISRLNHAVLWVRDATASATFFTEVLEFEIASTAGDGAGVFLRSSPDSKNDHDLALFSIGADAGPATERNNVGMYHLAWEVPTLRELVRMHGRLVAAGTLVGMSDHGVSKSLYAKDLDGLEHEVLWAVPPELLDPERDAVTTAPLDLDAEVERFGLDTAARATV